MKDAIEKRLASSLKSNNQQPNIDLAIDLAQLEQKQAILELVQLAGSGPKEQSRDAIKVLYELGKINPEQLLPHVDTLIGILPASDSRMIWGILQALNSICDLVPQKLMANLNIILEASDRSSVIAFDNMMAILAKINAFEEFSATVTPVLLMRLNHAAPNQFPTYVELASATIPEKNKDQLLKIIDQRLSAIASEAKRKRLLKIKKILQ